MKKLIPNRELDELGEGLVMASLRKSGAKVLPKCVDIVGVAESLGLRVVYEAFAEDDPDKVAFLANGRYPIRVRKNGGIVPVTFPFGTIVLDTSLRKEKESARRRFTIAHEIGHFVTERHAPDPQFMRNYDSERCYSAEELHAMFNISERNADRMGAAIIMPRFIVERALLDHNEGNPVVIYGENVIAHEQRVALDRMGAQVGASFTALLIRLRHFGLLEYHPLDEYIQNTLIKGVAS